MTGPEGRALPGDIESELWSFNIRLGVPLENSDSRNDESYIDVPSSPHIFYTQKLQLRENQENLFTIEDAMVIMAHGYGDGIDNWRFVGINRTVNDTVKAYEEAARRFLLPHLDAVLVCRNFQELQSEKVRVLSEQREIPYVWPESLVTIIRSEYPAGIFRPGEGVELVIANNRKWYGVERWLTHWNTLGRQTYRARRGDAIPEWAKNAL